MKHVLILNANPREEAGEFDRYCEDLAAALTTEGCASRVITLRDLSIRDCIGCYACWLKTPGICALKDDHPLILEASIAADFIVLASPVVMGFVSSLLKKSHDRMLPTVHPFLALSGDRMSHLPRYEGGAHIALLLDGGHGLDEAGLGTLGLVHHISSFIRTTDNTAQEVAHEIACF